MKNLLSRTLTGIIYVAVIAAGLCTGQTPFMALGILLAGLGVEEFLRITGNKSYGLLLTDLAGTMIIVTGCDTVAATWANGWAFPAFTVWGTLFTAWLILRIVVQLYSHNPAPLRRLACTLMAQMYVALPVALMCCVYNSTQGHALMLGVFVLIWVNDTGAYLVGSRIGRHRLFERLSPKKSWEGFFGGMALSIIASLVMYHYFPAQYAVRPLAFMAGLGVLIPIFATWGDLAESMIKRTLNVKDSGHILPGHGGILDRIDSLLVAVPATVVYLALWRLFL